MDKIYNKEKIALQQVKNFDRMVAKLLYIFNYKFAEKICCQYLIFEARYSATWCYRKTSPIFVLINLKVSEKNSLPMAGKCKNHKKISKGIKISQKNS